MTPTTPKDTIAIIVAGGVGSRMGSDTPKQFLALAGQPILWHSLQVFDRHPLVDGICVVVEKSHHAALRGDEPWTRLAKPLILAEPGAERSDSVRSGLAAVCDHAQIVLVHDAARPLVTAAMIDSTLEQARLGQGGIVARPVHETVKVVGDNGIIVNTSDRRLLWIAETPQAFPFDLLWRAHEHVLSEGLAVTDDAQAVEALGLPVAVCPAVTANPKITVPSDLTLAEAALAARAEVPAT